MSSSVLRHFFLLFPLLGACSLELPPPSGDLPCDGSQVDLWLVYSGGSYVDLRVDTVAPDTAFDPSFDVWMVDEWGPTLDTMAVGPLLASADDEFACTFPPPAYECPALETYAPGDILVAVQSLGTCAGAIGEYQIEATTGLSSAILTYFGTAAPGEVDFYSRGY